MVAIVWLIMVCAVLTMAATDRNLKNWDAIGLVLAALIAVALARVLEMAP